MQGNIQIIQTCRGEDSVLFSGRNMIVDGMRKTIADVMTYKPNPSGYGSMEVGSSSVSSYQVQAMTLGSAKDYYFQRDSRFFYAYASSGTSSLNCQLLTPKDYDLFPLIDSWSSIGFNQWKYDNFVNANILNSKDFTVELVVPEDEGDRSYFNYDYASTEGDKKVTHFEVKKGQQKVTLRQKVPLKLGQTYLAYSNVKAHKATFDIRIARGTYGVPFEYYDFTTSKFVERLQAKENTRHIVYPKGYFDIDEFVFKLRGNEKDQALVKYNEYFIEYIFPSKSFVDESFTPWQQDYQNPYVDVLDLELCSQEYSILPNSNFLEHQSVLFNSNFDFTEPLTEDDALNYGEAIQDGFRNLSVWTENNPILRSANPSNPENASGVGFVKPTSEGQFVDSVFSGMSEGVVLYASSNDITSSGCPQLSQTFFMTDPLGRNEFAFASETESTPTLIDSGYGQRDNNKTFMLYFDAMVSGESTAANCGHLEVELIRDSDGFAYTFSATREGTKRAFFGAQSVPKVFGFPEKNKFINYSVPVIFEPDAAGTTYTLNIRGRGRTDAEGFCYYGIRNLSFGPIKGWRTYEYDKSSVGNWSLSSVISPARKGGIVCSAIGFSGPRMLTFDGSAVYHTEVNDIKSANKNQLVTNFVGLEPTKLYRLAIKGTTEVGNYPKFNFFLKAKRKAVINGRQNILGGWGTSSQDTVPLLNPYSTEDTGILRRIYQSAVKSFKDPTTKPTDFSILLNSSGNSYNSAGQTTYADDGEYSLSMKVFNTEPDNSFFTLSASPNKMYNWETKIWDSFVTNVPEYRSDTSGPYYLPLPEGVNTDKFTDFRVSKRIEINRTLIGTTDVFDAGGINRRGDCEVVAAVWGPNAPSGGTYIKDMSLRGVGVDANDTVWNEKYYNFTTGDWQYGYDADVVATTKFWWNLNTGTAVTRNYLATPDNIIKDMCFAGLERDTEYQLNIIDVSGGRYDIHDISLVDVGLICNKGRERWIRDAGVFTSEPYDSDHYHGYGDGVVIKSFPMRGDFDATVGSIGPRFRTPNIYNYKTLYRTADTVDGNTSRKQSFGVEDIGPDDLDGANGRAQPWFIRTFDPHAYGLKAGDSFAIGWAGFEGTLADKDGVNVAVSGTVTAEVRHQEQDYQYNFSKEEWSPGQSKRDQVFIFRSSQAQTGIGPCSSLKDVANYTEYISPSLQVPSFTPAKIVVSLRMGSTLGGRHASLTQFKVYKTTPRDGVYRESGNTFLFPEFPNPTDKTLQSPGSPGDPDELGHFLNRIPYFSANIFSGATFSSMEVSLGNYGFATESSTGEKTYEQAIAMGAYLPSGGLFFGSGTFGDGTKSTGFLSGVLNTMGVVNSDGYIYPHRGTATDYLDASAGFVTSSYVDSEFAGRSDQPKILRYILRLHKDDWKFIDYYMGGVGAVGLHTIDYQKTFDKLGTAFALSGTGTAYTQGSRVGLYNVDDPTRNPVFNLVSKKIMFPPGLHIDYDNMDYLTIIWDINFMS